MKDSIKTGGNGWKNVKFQSYTTAELLTTLTVLPQI